MLLSQQLITGTGYEGERPEGQIAEAKAAGLSIIESRRADNVHVLRHRLLQQRVNGSLTLVRIHRQHDGLPTLLAEVRQALPHTVYVGCVRGREARGNNQDATHYCSAYPSIARSIDSNNTGTWRSQQKRERAATSAARFARASASGEDSN